MNKNSQGQSSSEDDDFFDFDQPHDILERDAQDRDFEALFRDQLTQLQLQRRLLNSEKLCEEGWRSYDNQIVAQLLGSEDAASDEVYSVIASAAKIHLAQLIEEAKLVQLGQSGGADKGPISPGQLKEARNRLIEKKLFIPEKE